MLWQLMLPMLCLQVACIMTMAGASESKELPQRLRQFTFSEPPLVNEDKRLEQKVHIEASNLTVAVMVDKLSSRTGVKLSVEPKLAGVKLFVRVNGRTLGDTLETLNRALEIRFGVGKVGWCWLNRGGELGYRLRLTDKASKPSLRLGYWEKRFRNFVRELVAKLKGKVSNVERLLIDEPWYGVWLIPPMRQRSEVWALLTDEEIEHVLDRGILYYPAERVPGHLRELYQKWLSECPRGLRDKFKVGGLYFARSSGYTYTLISGLCSDELIMESNIPKMLGDLRMGYKHFIWASSESASKRWFQKWGRIGKMLPLEFLKRYSSDEVLRIIAEHFQVDIIAVSGSDGRVFPKLLKAISASDAINALCRDFKMEKGAIAWHFFFVGPMIRVARR